MNNVKVVLPEKFDLVKGDTFQLFYRGIIEAANPYCYDILTLCPIGKNFPRYFEVNPTEVGEYPLTVTVYSNEKKVLAQGKTMLCVHEVKAEPKETVNILCVGDSLTAGGHWVHEAYRRLTDIGGNPKGHGFKNFKFIGTCTKDEVGFEGYGGWQWENYLNPNETELPSVWVNGANNKSDDDQHSVWKDSKGALWQIETVEPFRIKFNRVGGHSAPMPENNTYLTHVENANVTSDIHVASAYLETPNPFCNKEKQCVDFKSYCDKNGFDKIDAVYFLLTWNGMFGKENIVIEEFCKKLGDDCRKLLDIFHSQFPDAKAKVMGIQVPSVNGGMGNGYGGKLPYCDTYGMTRFVFELNRVYDALCKEEKYRDFAEFINISGQFDSDYNMPHGHKCVNTRNTQTEVVGTNGVHPMVEGYMQIGDAVYRNMVKEFCQG